MHQKKSMNHHPFTIVLASLFFLLVSGCSQKELQVRDTSFEKWRVMAENSTGHSPVPRQRSLDTDSMENTDSDGTTVSMEKRKRPDAPYASRESGKKIIRVDSNRPLPSKRMTMKMRDVEISALLRAMAKIADQNIIINENVKGRVNINVVNAPWDESFLSVLSSNGLTYSWVGSILRIMTLEDMRHDVEMLKAEQSKQSATKEFELSQIEIKSKVERMEPLVTKVLHVDYDDPEVLRENLWEFLKVSASEGVSTAKEGDKKDPSATTGVRGAILVDKHTNALMIQATKHDIERLIPLVNKLDRPTPQIFIKAQIVETTSDVARDLGIQWGGGIHNTSGGNNNFITAGANSTGTTGTNLDTAVNPTTGNVVNFPMAEGAAGMTLGYTAQKLGKNLLNVQLSALQEEGKLNILSSPTITTLDNKKAIIESGKEVPYQTKDEDGKTEIAYKRAVIRMEVTPHVIAGKELRLNILTTKDDIDWANQVDGNPAINTKQAETSVVLFDGSTTVIGGLSKETNTDAKKGVPLLQDIPFLGYLFKGSSKQVANEEILVFITPYILEKVDEARVGDDFQSESMYLPKPPKRVRFKP
jgi:type IV pilus assembly protein PilQ